MWLAAALTLTSARTTARRRVGGVGRRQCQRPQRDRAATCPGPGRRGRRDGAARPGTRRSACPKAMPLAGVGHGLIEHSAGSAERVGCQQEPEQEVCRRVAGPTRLPRVVSTVTSAALRVTSKRLDGRSTDHDVSSTSTTNSSDAGSWSTRASAPGTPSTLRAVTPSSASRPKAHSFVPAITSSSSAATTSSVAAVSRQDVGGGDGAGVGAAVERRPELGRGGGGHLDLHAEASALLGDTERGDPEVGQRGHRCRHSGSGAGNVSDDWVCSTPATAARNCWISSLVASELRGLRSDFRLWRRNQVLCGWTGHVNCVEPRGGGAHGQQPDPRLRQSLLRVRGRLYPLPGPSDCATAGCGGPTSTGASVCSSAAR